MCYNNCVIGVDIMPQPPQRAKVLSAAEIAARRAEQKIRRAANRRRLKAHVKSEMGTIWPYKVVLQKSITKEDRYLIRRWMMAQHMRTYDADLDNRDRSDVMWNDQWTVFRFAQEEHSVLFNMCFS